MTTIEKQAMGNSSAISVVGKMMDVDDPWKKIGERLTQPSSALISIMDATTSRRNDIIHRADRSKTDLDGLVQDISFSWTKQAVDNINNVCIALDELVTERMRILTEILETSQEQTDATL